jgi:hypothetical protein
MLMRIGGLMILLLFVAQGRPAPGKINSTYDKTAAFAAFKTYRWVAGQPAFNPAAHKVIVSAIDAEMAKLALKKVESPAGDVTLRYLAVRSTSVDLEKLEAIEKQGGNAAGADVTVGRLVIVMEEGKSSRRLWAADGVERLNPAVAELDQAISAVVARLFQTYPTRQNAK